MTLAIDLKDKKGLIIGVANEHSIAYGCARAFKQAGADLAVTYLNDKSKLYVAPLAEKLGAELMLCDVEDGWRLWSVFEEIEKKWGKLDFLLHSVAFANQTDLHGRVTDSSKEGFLQAMDISCHSFIRMAKYAEPLMKNGGSMLTVSFMGGKEVIPNYGIMGPIKAALESSVRYLAAELGKDNIRVNALSPGPVLTRAAYGIKHFDKLLEGSKEKAPLHHLVSLDDIGAMAAFLVSDLARNITGGIHMIDAGYEVMD